MQNSVRWTTDTCKLHRQWGHYKNVTLTATLNMEEHNGLNVWDVTYRVIEKDGQDLKPL